MLALGDVVHDEHPGDDAPFVVVDRRRGATDDQMTPVGEHIEVLLFEDLLARSHRAHKRPLLHPIGPTVRMEDFPILPELGRHRPAKLSLCHLERPRVAMNDPARSSLHDHDRRRHVPDRFLEGDGPDIAGTRRGREDYPCATSCADGGELRSPDLGSTSLEAAPPYAFPPTEEARLVELRPTKGPLPAKLSDLCTGPEDFRAPAGKFVHTRP